MHSSAIEMRSPAVSSMSISRPPGCSATSLARRTGRRSSCPSPRRRRRRRRRPGGCGRRGRRRPGCDRDRRPRCRRTSGRADPRLIKATGGPAGPRTSFRAAPVRSPRLCRAPTNEHAQKENARAKRSEAREAAQKREQRKSHGPRRRRRAPSSSSVAHRRSPRWSPAARRQEDSIAVDVVSRRPRPDDGRACRPSRGLRRHRPARRTRTGRRSSPPRP